MAFQSWLDCNRCTSSVTAEIRAPGSTCMHVHIAARYVLAIAETRATASGPAMLHDSSPRVSATPQSKAYLQVHTRVCSCMYPCNMEACTLHVCSVHVSLHVSLHEHTCIYTMKHVYVHMSASPISKAYQELRTSIHPSRQHTYIYIHTHTHTLSYTSTDIHMHAYGSCTRAYMYTCTLTCIRICTHTYARNRAPATCSFSPAYPQHLAHTYVHAHTYTVRTTHTCAGARHEGHHS